MSPQPSPVEREDYDLVEGPTPVTPPPRQGLPGGALMPFLVAILFFAATYATTRDMPPAKQMMVGHKATGTMFNTHGQQARKVTISDDYTCDTNDDLTFVTTSCSCDTTTPVLNGADPVAYFFLEAGESHVKGSSEYQATLNGYTFYFSSAENRDLFISEPWAYAPMFGAYCSWGVSGEYPPEWDWEPSTLGPGVDLDVWLIYDGHLYLFLGETPMEKFLEDVPGYSSYGITRWESWFGSLDESPFNTKCYVVDDDDDDDEDEEEEDVALVGFDKVVDATAGR